MKIYFDGTLIDSDNYISFSNEFKQFDETFMLGTTASNTITIEVPGNIAIPTNVVIQINNTDYATLIVDSYEYKDNNILELTLVDKMVLLDFNYNAELIVPCTVKQILQDICTHAGITLATTSFTNESLTVDYYDNTLTAREYVGMIAELNGGFARINTAGQLELVKFSGTPTNIDIESCEDFRIGEKHTIQRVVFDSGILKFETSTDETLETLYLNNQNVYITDETTFNNIANEILGFEFYCFSTGNCEIKPTVMAGDLINFTDGTNNYQTIAQYSVSYMGGLNGGYELDINSKKQEETKVIGVSESFKRLRIEVNRDLNQISQTVESIESTEGNHYQDLLDKYQAVDDQLADIDDIQHTVTQIQTDTYTKTEVQQIANGTGVNGVRVSAVISNSGTFDENGMTYRKTDAPTETTINEVGINTKDNNGNSLLFAGYVDDDNTDYPDYVNQTIVGTDNIIVKNYLNIGDHSRIQNYGNGTGIFVR